MTTSTQRPVWQLFPDKTLSIVLLASIPVIAILLLIVFCVLIYCCCKYRKQEEQLELTPEDLVRMKVTPEELKDAGITPKKLKKSGATFKQLAKLKATPSQLVECGATKQDLEDLDATPSIISAAGLSDKKNKNKDDYNDKNLSTKVSSNQNERLVNFANLLKQTDKKQDMDITTGKSNKRNSKYMEEEKDGEFSENIDTRTPDNDTISTVTTTTAATTIRPIKSDSFSTAMLAQGSEISTAPQPQPQQKKDYKRKPK